MSKLKIEQKLKRERKQFEKSQEASYRKAIKGDEVPCKMKHIRNLIVGSFTDSNLKLFWTFFSVLPPLSTDITCWKFCHTLHVILRDGHPNSLRDTQPHVTKLQNLGQHFHHLTHGYGRLIKAYCELLITKIRIHNQHPFISGSMTDTPEEVNTHTMTDVDQLLLVSGMQEYMDCILTLYGVVFLSMDPSRPNSMTRSGQCRLAPLIPCIQDSLSLYHCTVRILCQLYMILPPADLQEHFTRFHKQFELLKQFYNNTRNLQYFKGLIQVPMLPLDPPNLYDESKIKISKALRSAILQSNEETAPGSDRPSSSTIWIEDNPAPQTCLRTIGLCDTQDENTEQNIAELCYQSAYSSTEICSCKIIEVNALTNGCENCNVDNIHQQGNTSLGVTQGSRSCANSDENTTQALQESVTNRTLREENRREILHMKSKLTSLQEDIDRIRGKVEKHSQVMNDATQISIGYENTKHLSYEITSRKPMTLEV